MEDTPLDVPRLDDLRIRALMSKAELGRRAGMSYSMIKYIFNGEKKASPVTVAKLAMALGCKPADLLVRAKATRKRAA